MMANIQRETFPDHVDRYAFRGYGIGFYKPDRIVDSTSAITAGDETANKSTKLASVNFARTLRHWFLHLAPFATILVAKYCVYGIIYRFEWIAISLLALIWLLTTRLAKSNSSPLSRASRICRLLAAAVAIALLLYTSMPSGRNALAIAHLRECNSEVSLRESDSPVNAFVYRLIGIELWSSKLSEAKIDINAIDLHSLRDLDCSNAAFEVDLSESGGLSEDTGTRLRELANLSVPFSSISSILHFELLSPEQLSELSSQPIRFDVLWIEGHLDQAHANFLSHPNVSCFSLNLTKLSAADMDRFAVIAGTNTVPYIYLHDCVVTRKAANAMSAMGAKVDVIVRERNPSPAEYAEMVNAGPWARHLWIDPPLSQLQFDQVAQIPLQSLCIKASQVTSFEMLEYNPLVHLTLDDLTPEAARSILKMPTLASISADRASASFDEIMRVQNSPTLRNLSIRDKSNFSSPQKSQLKK